MLFVVVAAGAAVSACDGGGSSSGPGGGGGATSSSTGGVTSSGPATTTGVSTGVTSTSSGQPPICNDVLNGTSCADCIEEQCCAGLKACLEDPDCLQCFLDPAANVAQCAENNIHYSMLIACIGDNCQTPCGPAPCDAPSPPPSAGSCFVLGGGNACNPFTNEGCDTAAGDACDVSADGFSCYPPPNENMLCAACGQADGFCAPGMTCLGGACSRFCCSDADCGSGKCTIGMLPDTTVGVCQSMPVELLPCDGDPDGTCNPEKEKCGCPDCDTTALCNPGLCTDDGTCDIKDSCICKDCDNSPSCLCDFNDQCDPVKEACGCPDCWGEAECADNPQEKCTDDGACGPFEFCVCNDCKNTGFCLDTNHCTDNGSCSPYEGCVCTDCMAEPTCP